MTYGFDPAFSKISPFHGAMYAVIDSVTKLVAMGGDYSKARLTFQEYFERMTEEPATWAKPFSALLGALKVQKELQIPAIGGKDSMSGTFMDINVPPTLISFAVGTIDVGDIVSTELKKTDSQLVYLTPGCDTNHVINFEVYKKNMERVRRLIQEKIILSANTIGQGGVFISLVKMAAGNKIGATVGNITEKELHEADYGGLLLEIPGEEDVKDLFEGTNYKAIGKTIGKREIEIQITDIVNRPEEAHLSISLDFIIKSWCAPLEGVFPTRTSDFKDRQDTTKVLKISQHTRLEARPSFQIAKPRVLIPAFPGTNCEMDSKRTFERVGAIADIHIIRNLTETQLTDSIKEMERKIRESQIIMIPGGFSGGDEPDGSAKFITAVFRNPRIKEAVMELLEDRDGLILGICNGFQALIKLGLLPTGEIIEMNKNSPTLTYNKIGRHMSRLVRTRVASVKSPWLAGISVGDIHTIAISHGEGRFIANPEILEVLARNGQIATQYVDLVGDPSMDIAYNPNYSVLATEGITSPDGRIFGKMGHSERISTNIYKNVEGNKDQRIFTSGVNYFR